VSNRRRLPQQHPVSATIAALDGLRVPGGCGHCDAYQVVQANAAGPNVHIVHVYHDDWCPVHGEKGAGRSCAS
jgi:hypothetical protein